MLSAQLRSAAILSAMVRVCFLDEILARSGRADAPVDLDLRPGYAADPAGAAAALRRLIAASDPFVVREGGGAEWPFYRDKVRGFYTVHV